MVRGVALLCALSLLPGCLTDRYQIRPDELDRLATLPPEQRGQKVRVVQRLDFESEPPPETAVLPVPEPDCREGALVPLDLLRVPSYSVGGDVRATGTPTPVPGSSGGGKSAGSAASKMDPEGLAPLILAAVVAAGGVAVVALAVTEGMRHDGWVRLPPRERLYLNLKEGRWVAVPLHGLTPELARQAVDAEVQDNPLGPYERLGEAPLDRSGSGLSAGLLGGGVPLGQGRLAPGLGGHLNLGYNVFNLVSIGVSVDVMNALTNDTSNLYGSLGPELKVFPLRHVGLFASVGMGFRRSNHTQLVGATGTEGTYVRGGLTGEIPLNTRLALQLRLGVDRHNLRDGFVPWAADFSTGLAVY